jgi:hypothetical protein
MGWLVVMNLAAMTVATLIGVMVVVKLAGGLPPTGTRNGDTPIAGLRFRFAPPPPDNSGGQYAGLAPSPWQSGSIDRERGVSKAGNPRLRTTMVQLARLWLRHQPDSMLARWF